MILVSRDLESRNQINCVTDYVPPPAIMFPPPPAVSHNFVGRDDLILELIKYYLNPLSESDTHWITLLWGVAGIGKTQTSIRLWLEYRSR